MAALCCARRENALESLRAQLEEQEGDAHFLGEQLRRKEAEHQEALLQLRQHQADGQRSGHTAYAGSSSSSSFFH